MARTILIGCGFVAAICASVAARSLTQDKPAAPPAGAPDAQTAAWMKKNEPGPQHKNLGRFDGYYEFTAKAWPAPGQNPTEMKGSSRLRMVLGARFLQERMTADLMGAPFEGIGFTGFDTTKNKYVSTWTDSMSTFVTMLEGTETNNGDVLTFTGTSPNAAGGVDRLRLVWTYRDKDHHDSEMFITGADAKEYKAFEFHYTKATDPGRRTGAGKKATDPDGGN